MLLALAVLAQSTLVVDFDTPGDPPGWRSQTWGGYATYSLDAPGRGGAGRCLRVVSESGADGGWTVRFPVRPFSRYRFTGWIKTQNVAGAAGRGALFNLHGRPEHTEPLTGTADWKQVGFEFDTGGDDAIQLNALMGYHGQARGTAWYDDLRLEHLSSRTPNPQMTIDIAKTLAEPISPYVYGQFIEHLGRCIYGGIWAEMLEDRKFYWLPGTKESPWRLEDGLKAEFVADKYREQPVLRLSGEGALVQTGLELKPGVGFELNVVKGGVGRIRRKLLDGSGKVLHETTIQADGGELGLSRSVANNAFPGGPVTLRLEVSGDVRLAAVSLMPADNVKGFRRDTLQLLKQLDSPIYRWPGGNFVSAYDWRDGIGDRDRRPTRKNPAWQGIDSNDVGLHEFMELCDLIKTEPLVVVNTGFGDAHSAYEEVQYVNGAANSEWGAKRVKNGRREPWKVRWWGVGNEMYGDWQHGHMALNFYTQKHNDFARYMRRADPSIKLVGVGAAGPWSEEMLKECANNLDLLSEHFYTQERPSVLAHVAQMPSQVRRIAEAHRDYRRRLPTLKGKDIRIALDEWNYWYGPHVYGELGTIYFQKDALGVAAGLHEMFRHSDLYYMANYAQTVNVIGAIKTTKTKAAFDTTGLVLQKYREVFGTIPLQLEGSAEPLDAMAALTVDRKTLTIGIVNPMGDEQTLKLNIAGIAAKAGKRWELAHADPQAHNTPDKRDVVKWVSSNEPALGEAVMVKAYSVTILVMPIG